MDVGLKDTHISAGKAAIGSAINKDTSGMQPCIGFMETVDMGSINMSGLHNTADCDGIIGGNSRSARGGRRGW